MKVKFKYIFLVLMLGTAAAFGQSVVITEKKVDYKRPKPMADYKAGFVVHYPQVKAATPALSKKIEAAISYETVMKLNIKEELNDIQWLEEASYDVGYNRRGILSIALTVEGSGAYPSTNTKNVVVDLRNGTRVRPADIFTNLPGLLAKVRIAMNREVLSSIAEIRADKTNEEPHPERIFKEQAKYNPLKLDEFQVDEKGVTFLHDYGFPHVILALQPSGAFHYTWKELKPYIKRDGLLGQFVH